MKLRDIHLSETLDSYSSSHKAIRKDAVKDRPNEILYGELNRHPGDRTDDRYRSVIQKTLGHFLDFLTKRQSEHQQGIARSRSYTQQDPIITSIAQGQGLMTEAIALIRSWIDHLRQPDDLRTVLNTMTTEWAGLERELLPFAQHLAQLSAQHRSRRAKAGQVGHLERYHATLVRRIQELGKAFDEVRQHLELARP